MPTGVRYFGSLDLNLLREALIKDRSDVKHGDGKEHLSTSLSCDGRPDVFEDVIHSLRTDIIKVRILCPFPKGLCADMGKEGLKRCGDDISHNLPTDTQKHSFQFHDKGEKGPEVLALEDFLVKARDRIYFDPPLRIACIMGD